MTKNIWRPASGHKTKCGRPKWRAEKKCVELNKGVEAMDQFAGMTSAELNDWYERTVGYRPQVDSPGMTDAELRTLIRSYIQAAAE